LDERVDVFVEHLAELFRQRLCEPQASAKISAASKASERRTQKSEQAPFGFPLSRE
jgi:hypothetical protein